MATIVKLRLRDDDNHIDEIDLDRLSPRGRAIAEQLSYHRTSDRPPVWYAHDNGRHQWSGWSRYPADSSMDPHDYLEQQAAKAPAGWRVIPRPELQSARAAHIQMLKADAERATQAFRDLVVREASAERSEAAVAREAGVDRMTVRKWAGKR